MSETAAVPPPSSTSPALAKTESVNAATKGEQGLTETPPSSKTTVLGLKDNNKDNKDATTAKPSVIEQVKRYIPGLGSKDEPSKTASSKRKKSSNNKKSTGATDIAHAKDPALATATLETAPSRDELPKELRANGTAKTRPAGLNGGSSPVVEEETDSKKFSAAYYVQKRLRTNNKKIVSFICSFMFLSRSHHACLYMRGGSSNA